MGDIITSGINFVGNSIVGTKLGDRQLPPSQLNARLQDSLQDLKFKNFNRKSCSSYKENEQSIMFVCQSCNDVDKKDNNKFMMSGGRSISDALNEVLDSTPYQQAKENNKKIEIHVPLAITRSAYGISRAHWLTALITEKNHTMELTIVDSLPHSLGYNFSHIQAEFENFIDKRQDSQREDTKEDYHIVSSGEQLVMQHKYQAMGDQGLADHTSCGYYVIKYATEHAAANYSATTSHHLAASPEDKRKLLTAKTQARVATATASPLFSETNDPPYKVPLKRIHSASTQHNSTRDT